MTSDSHSRYYSSLLKEEAPSPPQRRFLTVGKLSVLILLVGTLSASDHVRTSGLGSAAMGSVTEALSPILPFAGGLDLRRKTSWGSLLFRPRGGDAVVELPRHELAISATEPFVSLKDVSEMTLGDVAEVFRYAIESNKEGFNENRFLGKLQPRVQKAILAMNEAILQSRGRGVEEVRVPATAVATSGNVDVLKFAAAMRLFADWRVIRQVPDGYKGYAVGMSLGQKDVIQNVGKIEAVVHSWIDGHSDEQLRSPTLRDLLEHEYNTGVHPNLPRLKERTGAMGLLWVRRQLQYQTQVFANVMQVPDRFDSTTDAVAAAYRKVYDRYHGWAVQKIFSYSFQSAPDADVIYRHMNPHKLKDVLNSVTAGDVPATPMPSSPTEADDNPIVGLVKAVGSGWDHVMSLIGGGDEHQSTEPSMDGTDDVVTREMKMDAYHHIISYLEIVQPLLDDLAHVIDEFNMDDPSRV